MQNAVLLQAKLAAKLDGDNKTEADDVLKELRNADESMRNRLFILQLWRKYDQSSAELYARRKAGECMDADLDI